VYMPSIGVVPGVLLVGFLVLAVRLLEAALVMEDFLLGFRVDSV